MCIRDSHDADLLAGEAAPADLRAAVAGLSRHLEGAPGAVSYTHLLVCAEPFLTVCEHPLLRGCAVRSVQLDVGPRGGLAARGIEHALSLIHI